MPDSVITTRTVYKLEVLAKDGWTVVAESKAKPTMMNRLAKMGTPEAIKEYGGICAARVVTGSGKLVARLPEGTSTFADVVLTNAQCKALAAERGEDFTEDEEAEVAAREAAIEAAKSDTRVVAPKKEGEKRSNVIGGLKRRPGTDARGFNVAVGDQVRVGKNGPEADITKVDGDNVTVMTGGKEETVGARKVTIVARAGGNPLVAVDAAGTQFEVGMRARSPWSGRTGTIEEIRPTGDVMMRHDANKAKVRHPGPSLVITAEAAEIPAGELATASA